MAEIGSRGGSSLEYIEGDCVMPISALKDTVVARSYTRASIYFLFRFIAVGIIDLKVARAFFSNDRFSIGRRVRR